MVSSGGRADIAGIGNDVIATTGFDIDVGGTLAPEGGGMVGRIEEGSGGGIALATSTVDGDTGGGGGGIASPRAMPASGAVGRSLRGPQASAGTETTPGLVASSAGQRGMIDDGLVIGSAAANIASLRSDGGVVSTGVEHASASLARRAAMCGPHV